MCHTAIDDEEVKKTYQDHITVNSYKFNKSYENHIKIMTITGQVNKSCVNQVELKTKLRNHTKITNLEQLKLTNHFKLMLCCLLR